MKANLTFGTFLAPFHAVGQNPGLLMQQDLELISWCDRLGFDEAWMGEHHSGGWEMVGDPAVFLAAAGERTRQIKLGSGVVSLPYHHPFLVADRWAQLDHMTGGRAMLGVGPGALISDAVMMGIDPVTQRSRMDESLGVILRLLAGEVVTHDSDWFQLREARLQLRPVRGSLPVAVASTTSPSGMTVAGKHGAGVLSLGAGLIGGKKNLAEYWEMGEQAAAEHGRTLDRQEWRLVIRAHLAEDRREAIETVRAGRDNERLNYFRRVGGLRNDITLEQEVEEDTALVGTPDDMIAALDRLWEATGGFGGYLVMAHDWAGREATRRSYELMARYVIPHFRGHLDPLVGSYEAVIANKRDYAAPAMAAIAKAYADAGRELPADLTPRNLR